MAANIKWPTDEQIEAMTFDEAKEALPLITGIKEQVQEMLSEGIKSEIKKLADLGNFKVRISGKPSGDKGTRTSKPRVDSSAQTVIMAAGADGIEEADVITK